MISLPESVTFPDIETDIAVAPDGSRVVFAAIQNGRRMLFVRSLDELAVTAIPGTENAMTPFFDPDGEWIGFFSRPAANTPAGWKKVPVRGGPAVTLTVMDGPRSSV